MTVKIVPIEGLPEVVPGDDLAELLAGPLRGLSAVGGDVLAVTQKVVSKAEGRVVPSDDRAAWVAHETRRVVARRGDLVIAETRHGFVCANAGVDASNVEAGWLTLLPEDPDGSAARIRAGLDERLGVELGVVVTDTFGRPWRTGLVNVAIGCAGLPSLVDLRDTPDHHGRALEATIVALADEVAAASGLVTAKATRVPAALVRGLVRPAGAPDGAARDLVRPASEDLFREAPLVSISNRRTSRSFGPGDVPRGVIEEAVRAACGAPAPGGGTPWLFVALTSHAARRRLLGAIATAIRADFADREVAHDAIERAIARSQASLAAAPVLIVPCTRSGGPHALDDEERMRAEREMILLSGGAAVGSLLHALHAQGIASRWTTSASLYPEHTRAALGLDESWLPLGAVAAGPMPEGKELPPDPIDVAEHLRWDPDVPADQAPAR
jgi:coenzyme F420-0:L-glutamate ligase/coenzyme F420-1:gamma-L-glutamate ligase